MPDLFPEELSVCQSKEIDRLKEKISDLENDCKWLNMIYRSAWDVAAVVCAEGSYRLEADEGIFLKLYDRMTAYDDGQDLRDRFEYAEKD